MAALGTTLVAGAGPGLGAALARRFAQAGSPVAVAARSENARTIAEEISRAGLRAIGVPYDVTDEAAVDGAIDRIERELGPIGTLVYNAGNAAPGDVTELTVEQFMAALRVGPLGAFLHARRLLPGMVQRGGGVIIFTGATSSVRAPARWPAFGTAKFGLRGLALALSREWSPKGVHVAHVLVDGVIRTPRSQAYLPEGEPALRAEEMAETYYQIAVQPPSAWTFELDLRPSGDDWFEN